MHGLSCPLFIYCISLDILGISASLEQATYEPMERCEPPPRPLLLTSDVAQLKLNLAHFQRLFK